MNELYLQDKQFLTELDNFPHRVTHVKIIALDIHENPIEEMIGIVKDGNLSNDSSSACRRTFSMSLINDGQELNNYYWGLNTKIKLFIGLENFINPEYPEIIWFPQGIFLITSISFSEGIDESTISIQGRDKMCLLDGTIGGTIPSQLDFGTVTNEDGSLEALTFTQIIKGVVSRFGNEKLSNIIINDLEDEGVFLLKYSGKKNAYLLFDPDSQEPLNFTNNEGNALTFQSTIGEDKILKTLKSPFLSNISIDLYVDDDKIYYDLDSLPDSVVYLATDLESISSLEQQKKVKLKTNDNLEISCYVIKYEKEALIGYETTPMTYGDTKETSQLICGVGETVTSILDKLVGKLNNYEYFYDVNGRFIFQEKKNYINTKWNNLITNFDEESYYQNSYNLSSSLYEFNNNELIVNFSNTPDISGIKNDYSIWGVTTDKKDIHLRYAIDNKPIYYKSFDGTIFLYDSNITNYYVEETDSKETEYQFRRVGLTEYMYNYSLSQDARLHWFYYTDYGTYKELPEDFEFDENLKYYIKIAVSPNNLIVHCDWREILYQMALDHQKHHLEDSYNAKLSSNNTVKNSENNDYIYYYPYGITGYEQYYEDILEFWRKIYNPDGEVGFQDISFNNIENINKTNLYTDIAYIPVDQYGMIEKLEKLNQDNYSNNFGDYKLYYVYNAGGYTEYYINDLLDQIDLYAIYKNKDLELYYSETGIIIDEEILDTDKEEKYKLSNKKNKLKSLVDLIVGGNDNEQGYINSLIKKDQISKHAIARINLAAEEAQLTFRIEIPSGGDKEVMIEENGNLGYGYEKDILTLVLNQLNEGLPYNFEINQNTGYLELKEHSFSFSKWIDCLYSVSNNKKINFYVKDNLSQEKKIFNLLRFCYRFKTSPEGERYFDTKYFYTPQNCKIGYCKEYKDKKYSVLEMLNGNFEDKRKNSKPLANMANNLYLRNKELGFYQEFIYKLNVNNSGRISSNLPPMYRFLDSSQTQINYYLMGEGFNPETKWTTLIETNPEKLTFWIDFLSTGNITKYSVPNIGDRMKAVKDENITAITYRTLYPLLFYQKYKKETDLQYGDDLKDLYNYNEETQEYSKSENQIYEYNNQDYYKLNEQPNRDGYTLIDLSITNDFDLNKDFSRSGEKKSAQNLVQEFLTKYAICAENITITGIPIYHLDSNTLISILNNNLKINGHYIIKSINLPLNFGGTMTLNATLLPESLF